LQAVARGFADDVDPKDIPRFEAALCQGFQMNYPEILERLAQPKKLDDEELMVMSRAIAHCKEAWQ
jgi:F0F1-type ATP synthase alpha subunit